MYKTNDDVYKRVFEHSTMLEQHYFFISAQGSWNYGLGYEGSDVDTKAAVFPLFKEIALNQKPISTTYVTENNEHIDIKDVRNMFNEFWKQNPAYVELLFSKYIYVNPYFKDLWNEVVELRDRIAYYDRRSAVKTICGQAIARYNDLEKLSPCQEEVVKKYGYSGKQLCHLLRMIDVFINLRDELPYGEVLTTFPVYSKDLLMAAKKQELKYEYAMTYADTALNFIGLEAGKYLEKDYPIDRGVREKVDEILVRLLQREFELQFYTNLL